MAERETPESEPEVPSEASVPESEAAGDVSATSASDVTPASDGTPGDEPTADAPKPRRKSAARTRAAKQPVALSPEERHAKRVEERRAKAGRRRVGRQRARTKARAAGGEAQGTVPREHGAGKQKTRQGVVVSDRAAKTITVRIDVTHRHPRYSKIVRTSSTLHAHDERSEAHVGDTVVVRECRPLSRTKRWRLVQVVERAE
jgi:small subunit ribosomal protein S17